MGRIVHFDALDVQRIVFVHIVHYIAVHKGIAHIAIARTVTVPIARIETAHSVDHVVDHIVVDDVADRTAEDIVDRAAGVAHIDHISDHADVDADGVVVHKAFDRVSNHNVGVVYRVDRIFDHAALVDHKRSQLFAHIFVHAGVHMGFEIVGRCVDQNADHIFDCFAVRKADCFAARRAGCFVVRKAVARSVLHRVVVRFLGQFERYPWIVARKNGVKIEWNVVRVVLGDNIQCSRYCVARNNDPLFLPSGVAYMTTALLLHFCCFQFLRIAARLLLCCDDGLIVL